MSTKIIEQCPECENEGHPIDTPVAFENDLGTYPVKLWRYKCGECGWIWANEAQRKHNDQLRRTQERKYRNHRTYFG